MIGNKISDKIKQTWKNLPQNISKTVEKETKIPSKRYKSPEERQNYWQCKYSNIIMDYQKLINNRTNKQ